jgi:hypothetical protein
MVSGSFLFFGEQSLLAGKPAEPNEKGRTQLGGK